MHECGKYKQFLVRNSKSRNSTSSPFKLNSEILLETEIDRGKTHIESDSELVVDRPVVTMAQEAERRNPPLNPFIDLLVRPRGLPILVRQNLAALDMPSNLPKFWGSKDENPSRHIKRFIKRLASSLITNPGYFLVWIPITLEGEAYEWYMDHLEGHFVGWKQMQREF